MPARRGDWTRVYVARTARTGMGLFANTPFAAGETLFVLKGVIRNFDYDTHFTIGPNWFGVGHERWLDPLPDSDGGFVNHSCAANSVVTGRRSVVAVRAIRDAEEITIDYSTTEVDPFWRMMCRCGQPTCRRVIRGVHSWPPHVYRRFEPYLSAFVRRARP
jgi:hypothetical protein